MRTPVPQAAARDLANELVSVLYDDWRQSWHQCGLVGIAKKIPGYIGVVIVIAFTVTAILSAPPHDSIGRYTNHQVVNGLHIALPSNLRDVAIEQLVPLP